MTSHLMKLYCSSTATAPSDSTSLLLKACKRCIKRGGAQSFRSLAWQERTEVKPLRWRSKQKYLVYESWHPPMGWSWQGLAPMRGTVQKILRMCHTKHLAESVLCQNLIQQENLHRIQQSIAAFLLRAITLQPSTWHMVVFFTSSKRKNSSPRCECIVRMCKQLQ